jgi:hypothetical protein
VQFYINMDIDVLKECFPSKHLPKTLCFNYYVP